MAGVKVAKVASFLVISPPGGHGRGLPVKVAKEAKRANFCSIPPQAFLHANRSLHENRGGCTKTGGARTRPFGISGNLR
jgi:hypothetical protein